jgi:hypothetical protein
MYSTEQTPTVYPKNIRVVFEIDPHFSVQWEVNFSCLDKLLVQSVKSVNNLGLYTVFFFSPILLTVLQVQDVT